MKKSTMLALLLAPAALFADPSVERVIVRQQWPWSTDVKVEYSLSGVDANNPVNISVRAFNGETELPSANLDAAITGDRYGVTDAVGSFTIDPVAAFGTSQIALGNFSVQLSLTASAANMADILYKIVDLDSPYTVTDVRRRDFYNGLYGNYVTNYTAIDSTFSTSLDDVLIWLDVTNAIYKTDKMVFRRIPAAGKSYMMQTNNASVNGGAGVEVSFAKDFYIGVFEVTQAQMNKFLRWYGANYDYPEFPGNTVVGESFETNAVFRSMRPATLVVFQNSSSKNVMRSPYYANLANHSWGSGFFYNMNTKTGLLVDLPTEAMWEYACRAGTTTALYSGKAYSVAEAAKLSRMQNNSTDRNCDLSVRTAVVGSYMPNAWGLYDMIGNVPEWCLDKWVAAGSLPGGSNPIYAVNGEYHVIRGAGMADSNESNVVNTRAQRKHNVTVSGSQDGGFRACIYLDNHDDGTK